MRKKSLVLLSVLFVVCFLVSPVLGALSGEIMFQGTILTATQEAFGYADDNYSVFGLTFYTNLTGVHLTELTTYSRRTGTPIGWMRVNVYNFTDMDLAELNELPSPVAQSALVNVTALSTVRGTAINWSFPGTYELVADRVYMAAFEFDGSYFADVSNAIGFDYDDTVTNYAWGKGYFKNITSTWWSWAGANGDMRFVAYGDGGATGGGDDTGDSDGTLILNQSDTDTTISSLMSWFIYLIVMIAPAWFLGLFLKMGKWGFVIGLAIGAGLGFAFLAGFPMWLLILVAVGEAGLVYSTVSREG